MTVLLEVAFLGFNVSLQYRRKCHAQEVPRRKLYFLSDTAEFGTASAC
jgi:hypothetical protein